MDEELILSDVHVFLDKKECISKYGKHEESRKYISRFYFKNIDNRLMIDHDAEDLFNNVKDIEFDEDGDQIISRSSSYQLLFLTLEHSMETILANVGEQVWLGSFFMGDFLLNFGNDILVKRNVLELGCGTGMCGIIAGIFADKVYCTDIGCATLDICRCNIERNQELYNYLLMKKELPDIFVKKLDWSESEICWNLEKEDLEELFNTDILIAADVIYQENITDDFFATVMKLMMNGKSKVLYLSLEKRINFTLHAMDVVAPAYQYFLDWLSELSSTDSKWVAKRITTMFEKYFDYNRVPQLVSFDFCIESKMQISNKNKRQVKGI
ncbi:Methyltransferase-like protein 22 [Nymphon striatum]|nr:Methyltransferase-like protein 22 [Nymphon striatum]